jgi:two-component system, OmpR family, alkaline phosphatase synthesis response regulator PhoP
MNELSQVRLILVEDEENVGSTLVQRLKNLGAQVRWAKTHDEAELLFSEFSPDLAILDVSLPDGSGFNLGAKLRKSHPSAALIFLTARSSPEDRIKGLELGAEDYVAKPFHFKELLLRIQNALRRSNSAQKDVKEFTGRVIIGEAEVDFEGFRVKVMGHDTPLTQKEWALLRFLFENEGKVLSRDDILNEVWSLDEYPSPRTVDNFIMRLRRMIEQDPEKPVIIKSIRGVGYQLCLKN